MKVVILAGGIGYRLKEETEFKPKPMVTVGNVPIIWHIMKIYMHYGFNDFIVPLGYKGEVIKEYFKNKKYLDNDFTLDSRYDLIKYYKTNGIEDDNFKITLVDTGLETLPGERILRIKDYIPKEDEDFMVTYGDGLSDIDIKKLFKYHQSHKLIGTVTGVHPVSRYGLLSIDGRNLVYSFKEKPLTNEWINGGFMVFKRGIFKHIRKGEYEHSALKRLISKKQLSVYKHEGFWYSMDTYSDVNYLNKMWKSSPPWKVWK